MKVTTTVKEHDLVLAAEKYADKYSADDSDYIKTDVLNAFYHGADFQKKKQGDTLTVSKLRPMCDAPKNGKFLVVLNTEDAFHECSFLSDGRVKIGTVAIRIEYCIGWIPCAIYKQELTGDGEETQKQGE